MVTASLQGICGEIRREMAAVLVVTAGQSPAGTEWIPEMAHGSPYPGPAALLDPAADRPYEVVCGTNLSAPNRPHVDRAWRIRNNARYCMARTVRMSADANLIR